MPEPTLKELAARVAELEARDERAAAVGRGEAPDNAGPIPRRDVPTKTVYDVRSEQTGSLVIPGLDSRELADSEAARLNGEASKVLGVNRRMQTVHAGGQAGRPTKYVVEEREVEDGAARRGQAREGLEAQLAQAKKDKRLDEPARPPLHDNDEPPTVGEVIQRQLDGLDDEERQAVNGA